jgi:hypothetical protein
MRPLCSRDLPLLRRGRNYRRPSQALSSHEQSGGSAQIDANAQGSIHAALAQNGATMPYASNTNMTGGASITNTATPQTLTAMRPATRMDRSPPSRTITAQS